VVIPPTTIHALKLLIESQKNKNLAKIGSSTDGTESVTSYTFK
jgi:hypothetical protein